MLKKQPPNDTPESDKPATPSSSPAAKLSNFPPFEKWDDWTEYDARSWPKKVERRYSLVPTICFNCEAACGLLAYVDKESGEIRKLEGNPQHPASRGRNSSSCRASNSRNSPRCSTIKSGSAARSCARLL